jgi:geranyl-CoA carboxylase alpha subunit
MFRRVLVANRGEIAVRVMRSLREMGIESVGVASEPDAHAPHAVAADVCRIIGPAAAGESYLAMEKVIAAARETGAEAVHPGYGFLSENARFAEAVVAAGLTWIGPSPEAMRVMGSKIGSRERMIAAGVPVVPGFQEEADDDRLAAEADRIGYPVLVKASAGGGGKGMRVVEAAAGFRSALGLARSEAEAAFGDGTVYLERYLARPRHVEVQVFGDASGRVFHLGERECSVQRRHQKILEESPSPAVDPDLRARMGEAAVAAAEAVDYVGAGTVEFLLDEDGSFYFLEMNTRLQVEHPVTELVYGVDLVRAQVLTAAGEPLPFDPAGLVPRGHAIEARLYAEDPAQGFLPQAGPVLRLRFPEVPGIRVDAALAEGNPVDVHYDPLLAKIIAFGGDRAEANARLHRALADTVVLGVTTNLDFLADVVALPAWAEGRLHTGFLDEHLPAWAPPAEAPPEVFALAAAAFGGGSGADAGSGGSAATPWTSLGSWTPLEDRS